MPARPGGPLGLRRDARPQRRRVPARPRGRHDPRRPPLHPGHDDPADHLADPYRLDRRPRLPVGRPVVPHRPALEVAPAGTDRPRQRAHAHPRRALRLRQRRPHPRLRAGLRLRPQGRAVALDRRRLQRRRCDGGQLRYRATAAERPADRLRGPAGAGPAHPARGRHLLRRDVVVRPAAADELRGGRRGLRAHRPVLARVAQPRALPRPPVAGLPAAQRAHPQGPVVRADRCAAGRRHHLAARNAGR